MICNIHFWSAQLLIIIGGAPNAVVFTGAYIPPRRFNYLLRLALFVSSILNFTGYILRWDAGIQWALVVGTEFDQDHPVFGNKLYIIFDRWFRTWIAHTDPFLRLACVWINDCQCHLDRMARLQSPPRRRHRSSAPDPAH
ncbi:MAG: cytochrome b N-terminal domain-containing protein [Anaerolineales bacterium]|nr:cytochrome b N-terminal domain-containing protein [Anaerolineales bacterium]